MRLCMLQLRQAAWKLWGCCWHLKLDACKSLDELVVEPKLYFHVLISEAEINCWGEKGAESSKDVMAKHAIQMDELVTCDDVRCCDVVINE